MSDTLHNLIPADHRILIVDDAPENIDILAEALSAYRKMIATNGERALNIAFGENKPDLILLDIEMPGIDGYEVCRQLKADKKTSNIPVIFLTSRSERKDIVKGFQIGAEDYISKPFDIEELTARVNTHLELKIKREALELANQFLEEQVALRTRDLNNANIKLEKALRDLQILDTAKVEFLRMISHEIRTPLNGIINSWALIKDRVPSDEMMALFSILEESTMRLEKFSYMALEITNLRTKGGGALNLSKMNLGSLIEKCSGELSSEIEDKKIELHIRHATDESYVTGDSTLINKVFLTLLGNAVIHSPEGGVITIEGSSRPGIIIYKIIDQGKGFGEKVLETDFQPMILGEQHIDDKTGLGLHFSKLAMDALSGEIRIGNNVSGGAFVELEFPVSTD